jgi:predicted ATP-grasp superfamily ATP-dependent carboligase
VGGDLLIFGASARAAAFSALRAGLRPWCLDLFADADLQARCPAMRLPGKYPEGFLDWVGTELPGPWMYTGGLENRPWLVERMAQRRPLWGNNVAALLAARNPSVVSATARAAGLPAPGVEWFFRDRPRKGRWLVKPMWGAGGGGIHFWSDADRSGPPAIDAVPHLSLGPDGIHFWTELDRAYRPSLLVYVQEYIEGESRAALYCGDGKRAALLGVTRQLVGADWLHAAPFHYCGSVGPLEPSAAERSALEKLGNVLAARCGLRGLFGIDGVARGGGFYPVEVNPRYTASVEVLEHATGLRALAWHRRAFDSRAERPAPPAAAAACVGKAVLFAPQDETFPADGPWADVLRSPPAIGEAPAYADIPPPNTHIKAGRPVLTFFARAATPEACEEELRRTAGDLDWRLFPG